MRHYSILRANAAIVALMSAALLSAPARAAHTLKVCSADGRCGQAQPIDEMQMAGVAGRYTIAGEVVGMNLMMASSWQAANGQKLEGKAMLSIALPGSGRAQIHYGTQAGATDPQNTTVGPANPAATVSTGAGLHSIDGVSQVVQVAGDGNGASNQALINVSAAPAGNVAGNGQLNASYQAANGAQAAATIAGNGVSLQLTIPGAGVVQQQINAASLGHIHQNIQLAADRQQVMNQLQLQLQIRPPSSALLASGGVGQAIDMLRGK